MAQINNSEIIKNIIDKAKIQISVDKVPSQLAEKVVPVMEVEPTKLIKVQSRTFAGAVHTTSSTKRTFLTGINGTGTINTAGTAATPSISGFPLGDGVVKTLHRMNLESGAAATEDSTTDSITFPFPIELEKSTAITVVDGGATTVNYVIYYYEID